MRTVLGQNWFVKDKNIQTTHDVVLPENLDVEKIISSSGGLNFRSNDDYFKVFVSGVHPNDPELHSAFDNTLIFETISLDNANNMEVAFWDKENARPSLVLNQGASGRASLFERSVIVGAQKGLKALDSHYTEGGDFANLSFDTALHGADLGVENDLEVKGIVYTDQIKQSSGSEVKIDDLKVDNIKIDNVITDVIRADSVEVNDTVTLLDMAGGGNRTVMVNNNGVLYAS